MPCSDNFRKLNFNAVASGVQNMKNNEFSKLANPINQQIDGFQSDIEGLQKSLADQSTSLGTPSSILELAGGLAAQKGMSKLGGKLISKVKEKFGIKDSKKNQMRIMNQKQMLMLNLPRPTFQVKLNLMFLKVIILMSLHIPHISQVLLNQIERNEGKQYYFYYM